MYFKLSLILAFSIFKSLINSSILALIFSSVSFPEVFSRFIVVFIFSSSLELKFSFFNLVETFLLSLGFPLNSFNILLAFSLFDKFSPFNSTVPKILFIVCEVLLTFFPQLVQKDASSSIWFPQLVQN